VSPSRVIPRGDLTLEIIVWDQEERWERLVGHRRAVIAIPEPHLDGFSFVSEAVLSDDRVHHELWQMRESKEEAEEQRVDLMGYRTEIIRGWVGGEVGRGRKRWESSRWRKSMAHRCGVTLSPPLWGRRRGLVSERSRVSICIQRETPSWGTRRWTNTRDL
jgi:hypothetical protein